MAAITTTGTLTAGNSRTFALAPGSALTLTLLPNCRVTVTETPETVSSSDAGGNSPRTHNHQFAGVFTYGPYVMGGSVVVDNASNSGSTVTWGRKDTTVSTSSDGLSLVSGAGNVSPLNIAHPRYWFHGFAPTQSTDDAVFRDLVAGNNGVFGANLSKVNAWANKAKGYISNVDPISGATDSVIRIPGPNFDYNGGQSLLIWWAGQCTPEGSDTHLMGSSASSAAGGMAVRLHSTGRLSFVLYGGGNSRFSSTTTDNVAGKPFVAGEYHTFGILVNGRDKTQSMWVDGQINASELVLSSGDPVDTLSSATWNIGTAAPAGGTIGVAANTLAFAGLKFLASDTLPTIGQITAAFQALGRDPRGLLLVGAL